MVNGALHDMVVELNGNLFIDPSKTLESTMRVLQVVKQVGASCKKYPPWMQQLVSESHSLLPGINKVFGVQVRASRKPGISIEN